MEFIYNSIRIIKIFFFANSNFSSTTKYPMFFQTRKYVVEQQFVSRLMVL